MPSHRKTGRRYADIRFERASVAAPALPSVNQAALAAAPEENVVERFLGHGNAGAPAPQNCAAAAAGLGAISLACEEVSGRLRTGPRRKKAAGDFSQAAFRATTWQTNS